MRRIAVLIYALFASIVATDTGYRVTFMSRDNNSQVLVFKQCWVGSAVAWQSAQGAYIDYGDTVVDVPRGSDRGIPKGSRCTIVGYVYAYQVPDNADAAGNKDPEYVAESTEYLEEQH